MGQKLVPHWIMGSSGKTGSSRATDSEGGRQVNEQQDSGGPGDDIDDDDDYSFDHEQKESEK